MCGCGCGCCLNEETNKVSPSILLPPLREEEQGVLGGGAGQWRLLRFGVIGKNVALVLWASFSLTSSSCFILMMLSVVEEVGVSPSSSPSSRRRLRDGAGGGVYWLLCLMRDALGPCDGYRFFDFWIFDEQVDEESSFEDGAVMKEMGLSNEL